MLPNRRAPLRRTRGLLLAVVMMITGIGLVAPVQPAQAADLTQFDPGNIISDEVFWDKNTMTESEIQSFIVSRLGSCSSGATCLINWRGDTWTRGADAQCGEYQGEANESAARIIYKVSQACGINPRVLLVTLQKEQGLLSSRAPSASAWRAAMGYGCPDTAPCDAQYYGFYNQVYKAAWQFKRYAVNPGGFRYKAGQWNTIQWHPNASCGSTSVFISNQATAGLYNYTPYRPNAAALAAGYGTGDSCSTYGNRNFFNYFSDWFGPTTYAVPGDIGVFWRSIGASASEVGSPLGGAAEHSDNGGGWTQEFTKGYIYISKSGGRAGLRKDSAIFQRYATNGSQYGAFGWPRFSERCGTSSCLVGFDHASIGWTAAKGIQVVEEPIHGAYAAQDYERGPLGVPTSGRSAWMGVDRQEFERGIAVVVEGAAYALHGTILTDYVSRGGPGGALGRPMSSVVCGTAGCSAEFENGLLVTASAGATSVLVSPDILSAYRAEGALAGVLGLPVAGETRTADGVSQRFAGGSVYREAGGTAIVLYARSGLYQRYLELGGATGSLGWPVSAEQCTTTTCMTRFENGVLTWSGPAGVRLVPKELVDEYFTHGGLTGPGVASSAFISYGAGAAQDFTRGYIYSSAAGTHYLRKDSGIFQRYGQLGSQYSSLGWPASSEVCTNGRCWTAFQNGRIGWTSSTGVRVVPVEIVSGYDAQGGDTGPLGMPIAEAFYYGVAGGGKAQDFQGGYVYNSGSGSYGLRKDSAIFQRYAALGSQYGRLGWPASAEVCIGTETCAIQFQNGTITWKRVGGITVAYR